MWEKAQRRVTTHILRRHVSRRFKPSHVNTKKHGDAHPAVAPVTGPYYQISSGKRLHLVGKPVKPHGAVDLGEAIVLMQLPEETERSVQFLAGLNAVRSSLTVSNGVLF